MKITEQDKFYPKIKAFQFESSHHTKSYPMGSPHVVKADQFADFYQIVDEREDEKSI